METNKLALLSKMTLTIEKQEGPVTVILTYENVSAYSFFETEKESLKQIGVKVDGKKKSKMVFQSTKKRTKKLLTGLVFNSYCLDLHLICFCIPGTSNYNASNKKKKKIEVCFPVLQRRLELTEKTWSRT
jgi:hypothetical protein